MKKIILLIGAVVLIASLGYVYVSYSSSSENEFDLDNTDDNLQMKTKIDLILEDKNGNKRVITDQSSFGLTVEYEGSVYESITWKMLAQANTPSGAEPYDNCEIAYAYPLSQNDDFFHVNSVIFRDADGNGAIDVGYTPELFDYWYPTDVGPVEAVIIPVDDNTYHDIAQHTIYFDDVFDGSEESGQYTIMIGPGGHSKYRGISTKGDGEWQGHEWVYNQGFGASFQFTYTGTEINVDFTSDVTWS